MLAEGLDAFGARLGDLSRCSERSLNELVLWFRFPWVAIPVQTVVSMRITFTCLLLIIKIFLYVAALFSISFAAILCLVWQKLRSDDYEVPELKNNSKASQRATGPTTG